LRFYTNVQMVGDDFLVRGYDNGRHFTTREKYSPTLFLPSNNKTKYKTLEGNYVEPIQPGSVKDCREFYKKYKDVENFNIYGNNRFIYQYISDQYPEDEIKFDLSKIKLVTIDIEVASENGFPTVQECIEEILAVTIQDYNTKKIFTWGIGQFQNTDPNIQYFECWTEKELLNKLLLWLEENPPEVITGWNCSLYDIPYVIGRLEKVLGTREMKRISPWKLVTQDETYIKGQNHIICDIGGITILDYLELYKKFTYTNQERYSLDHIAFVELGEKKLDHTEYETFKEFYTKDWQKYIEYNIKDVQLVDRLEDKMKLIELAITMAFDAKVNFNDVFYQVRTWDAIIYNYLKKRNIVIPPKEDTSKDDKYEGAYVKEPVPGIYNWVVNFDLNSLYPHLIMEFNISPETLVEGKHHSISVKKVLNQTFQFDLEDDYAICPNGAMYRKDIYGFLPQLMQSKYDERVNWKKLQIATEQEYEKTKDSSLKNIIAKAKIFQLAKKIQLNSAYGAVGNQYFRYYKLENAEAITTSGQVAIRWIEAKLNKYMNRILKTEDVDYVIASDTDSVYLHMGPLVEKVYEGREKTTEGIVSFLDKICQVELEKYIESSYEELAKYLNAYQQKMQMKRECIADRGIWIAKKRYILNVYDSEGVRYSEPKLKMMGIEAVKSSTPASCRQMIKDALKVIMAGTESDMIKFISKCKSEFNNLSPEEISFPRSVSDVVKYRSVNEIYSKGTPIHVRGALLYNHYIKNGGLDKKYALIHNGEKIKFCYLKKPNPIHENVISFIQRFPTEIGIDSYIDYELQFEKSFLDPLKSILNCIGWDYKERSTLESFFV
jgi:DNA polymerase elongation subunit (family B)